MLVKGFCFTECGDGEPALVQSAGRRWSAQGVLWGLFSTVHDICTGALLSLEQRLSEQQMTIEVLQLVCVCVNHLFAKVFSS